MSTQPKFSLFFLTYCDWFFFLVTPLLDTNSIPFWFQTCTTGTTSISNLENLFTQQIYTTIATKYQVQRLANLRFNIRHRTILLKRLIQGLVFYYIPKGQEFKSWVFFEGPRRFRGSQKSEKFNFSKRTNKSVDHKFKSFATNWPQISI